jgi:hypothetical protein
MSDKPLPQGWRIVSLHYADNRDAKVIPARGRVSDAEIEAADAIRVSHTNRTSGATAYRTIHGAHSKSQVGDLIRHTIREVSPV